MGMKLSQITGHVSTVTVEYGGQSMNVDATVGSITPEYEAQMLEALNGRSAAQGDQLAEMVSKVVVRWELLDDAGEVIPPTFPNCRKLPTPFLAAVIMQVAQGMAPGKGIE